MLCKTHPTFPEKFEPEQLFLCATECHICDKDRLTDLRLTLTLIFDLTDLRRSFEILKTVSLSLSKNTAKMYEVDYSAVTSYVSNCVLSNSFAKDC